MGDNFSNIKNSFIINRNNIQISSTSYEDLAPLLSKLLASPPIDKDPPLSKEIQNLIQTTDKKEYGKIHILWDKIKSKLPAAAQIAHCADAITNIINLLKK
ncbi:MAG: hypothetical protein AB7U59_10435 [Desulfovibrionaceae bacterium]|jgi:hypothetical protein